MSQYRLVDFSQTSKYNDIAEKKIMDLQCKHIAEVNSKNTQFLRLAEKVGYEWVVFGSHRFMKEEERLPFEIERIGSMAKSESSYSMRVVICSDNRVYIDNTHWALAYVKRHGNGIKLKEVPFYIVDFSEDIPKIVDVKGSVIKKEEDIVKAIDAANDVEKRVQKGWRPKEVSYTLKELKGELQNFSKLNSIYLTGEA